MGEVNTGGPDPDIDGVRRLYRDSAFNKAVFDNFAGRSTSSVETTVDRLHAVIHSERAEVSRQDIVGLFQALARRGCGKFVIGRKGHPSRFQWKVDLVSVGKVATGEAEAFEPLIEPDPLLAQKEEDEFIVHPYMLRPDLRIELALPRDLTSVEANRIADFVRTLPFVR